MTLVKKTERPIKSGQTVAEFVYKLEPGDRIEFQEIWYSASEILPRKYRIYELKTKKGLQSNAIYAKVVAFSKR